MTPAQQQEALTVISDVQIGIAALQPFTALAGPEQPGVALTIGLVTAGLNALQGAISTGTDITDAQLATIKQGEQAAINDDVQAQKDAWDAGDHSGVNPYTIAGSTTASTSASASAGSTVGATLASGPATAAIEGLVPVRQPTNGNYTSSPGNADGTPSTPGPAAGAPKGNG